MVELFSGMLTIWIADGYHSVHILAASEMDAAAHENAGNEIEEKPMDISGIFSKYFWFSWNFKLSNSFA